MTDRISENGQIRRIREMEQLLNQVLAWVNESENLLGKNAGIDRAVRALEDYYGSSLWKADFEADEAGLLPADLARGVLSEDGIDHALQDFRDLKERFAQEICREDYELKSARFLAAEILRRLVKNGDTVIDATMGNGHDTLFLCSLVGESGRVYAFDIQRDAVEATRSRLTAAGMADRAELLCIGHEKMAGNVPGPVKAVVFNLGWLPGGDHQITTRTETTLQAVRQALELLIPGGRLVVCVYPGHKEGTAELAAMDRFFSTLPCRQWNVLKHSFSNAGPGTPVCFAVQRMKTPVRSSSRQAGQSPR